MKRLLPTLPILFTSALIILAFSTVIIWNPSDIDAAWIWNLAIILAPALALLAQWKAARERQFPIVTVLTVVAILNTSLVIGSRLGAWTSSDWSRALTGAGLPDFPGKTIMGGLILLVVVYYILQRWWRLPASLADVLILGLPLAAVSGRVGCLVAGCCYGIPTGSDWGIAYGPGTPAYTHQLQSGVLLEGADSTTLLFPIQLFLIASNLLIFIFLWRFRKSFMRPGSLALLGFGLLTFQRFGVEFIREVATNRGTFGLTWGGLKTGQWIMLIMALGSIAGFCALQFWAQKKVPTTKNTIVGIGQLAYALGGITFLGFLLRDLLTFEEAMVMLISCIPAIWILGRHLWREHHLGKSILAPASMLSVTAIILIVNPLDTIAPQQNPKEWKQWMEVGAGGSFGTYKEINRDCDGNVISEDNVKINSGGGEISAHWQRGWTKLQVGLRGTFGTASTDENNNPDNNYTYSSYGAQARISDKWIGLSLGVFNRQERYPGKVGLSYPARNELLPSGSLHIGRRDRYFVDFRVFDEPALGLSNEPVFSMGLVNWGFEDPSGNSLLRVGFAVTSPVESALNLAGQFPLGDRGLSGGFSAYLGRANMFSFGLRYRFKEK